MGAELMLAVNLGTRGTLEALDLLEYTNIRAGSALAEQRAARGSPDPFSVRNSTSGTSGTPPASTRVESSPT